MLSREATNTNFIVFGFTRSGLEPTIYHARGEHTNRYTTDAVVSIWSLPLQDDCSTLLVTTKIASKIKLQYRYGRNVFITNISKYKNIHKNSTQIIYHVTNNKSQGNIDSDIV